jgi:hypothetical protein
VIAQLNTALEGRYTVERLVGEGGMATVYLARDLRHRIPPLTVRLNWHGAARSETRMGQP